MTTDPGIVLLVLLAAVLHASWNAMVKAGTDKLVTQALMMTWAAAVPLAAIWFLPIPAMESWPFLACSIVIHTAYYLLLVGAYEAGDLSQVYPIARGSAPMIVALGAFLVAGESMSLLGVIGVIVVSLGILSLAWRRRRHEDDGWKQEKRAILLAMGTGLSIASYSISDGMGARASGHAIAYIAWMFLLEPLPLLVYAMWRRRGVFWMRAEPILGRTALGGLISMTAYGIVIWAMSQAPLAHVVALRETSVIIAAFIATRLMGEGFGAKRIAAAVMVAAGAALLQIGG
jgi:drug/metabolite transporter (DMT)-like permease